MRRNYFIVALVFLMFFVLSFLTNILGPIIPDNSVKEHHGAFAGILCTGIMGGAVVPLIIGKLGDTLGLRSGMMFLYLTFGCVALLGLWAKPIITNATIRIAEKSKTVAK